ncbi:hypothetical protein JTE90_007596 [Oedothorax gibbosus]|uniref:Uncharacterized protein n=1 Tax=Oedothorax gibbosus TaxID=931172 RepID=A0AAV6U869_9ARAC|nr:hypothetical protein JTE90_007596 [Oedothorax gibbosus]
MLKNNKNNIPLSPKLTMEFLIRPSPSGLCSLGSALSPHLHLIFVFVAPFSEMLRSKNNNPLRPREDNDISHPTITIRKMLFGFCSSSSFRVYDRGEDDTYGIRCFL